MKIALIDDEQFCLHTLKNALLSALSQLGMEAERIDEYTAPEAFLAAFEKDKYDAVLLDIYMDSMNGIDAARKIRALDADVALVFCTSSNEFAAESYEVEAKYYLTKPISQDKVMAMLRRLDLQRLELKRAIRLPDGFRVPLRYILYTEYLNHSVQFHIQGHEPHSVYMNQSEAEKLLLCHKGFCLVNKGCIVNFANVRKLEANSFLLRSGESVPVARRRFKEISAAYTTYRFERMDEEEL